MVGKKKLSSNEIYEAMLLINDNGTKITITALAKFLECSTRTVHRNMTNELKKEKELLNREL
jgi:transcriptional antiterminator